MGQPGRPVRCERNLNRYIILSQALRPRPLIHDLVTKPAIAHSSRQSASQPSSSIPGSPRLLQVALPVPLRRLFDYHPPEDAPLSGTSPQSWVGRRVLVPFGSRKLVGIVCAVSTSSALDPQRLKRAIQVLDDQRLLPEPLLELAQWAADYYQHPLGEVLQTMLPNPLLRPTPSVPRESVWLVSEQTADSPHEQQLQRAPRQLALLHWLQANQPALVAEVEQAGFSRSLLAELSRKALVKSELRAVKPAPVSTAASGPSANSQDKPTLNREQQAAVQAIVDALGSYSALLLHGVTGSGKTEVYLRAMEAALDKDQQCLVLVPEIGLTPQTLARFEKRFSTAVYSLHSGLSDSARLQSWHAARNGVAQIVIGTRSALFVPMPRLGLIIVDEEHDASFKQQDGFRYSARDLALVRARRAQVPVVLGSATPSLESLHNAAAGKMQKLTLTARAGNARVATMRLIPCSPAQTVAGLSAESREAIASHLARDEQVLVFINRRGFSPVLSCSACGYIEHCPNCSSPFTVHSQPAGLRCHHCGLSKSLPRRCEQCQSPDLQTFGVGTQRLDSFLQSSFPEHEVIRIDRDAVRRKGSLEQKLQQLAKGKPAILVGTQMLTKGHHFPRLGLVVVVDADGGLFSADFRGLEFMAQTILQVAGRAGRAEIPGEVLVQTQHAEHDFLCRLTEQDFSDLGSWLLESRRCAALPPFSHFALLRCEAAQQAKALGWLRAAHKAAASLASANRLRVDIGEALISPIERRAGRFRFQLLFQSSHRGDLNALLKHLLLELEAGRTSRGLRWSLDVDPIDML